MPHDPFADAIEDEAELRAIYAEPSGLAAQKQIDRLDSHCRNFIACAPLVLIASADAGGRCDVTPRGGPPGFVSVLSDVVLAIPDATGNRRIDTMRNVVRNGQAGLLFLIPGRGQTLRVNGRACVTANQELLAGLHAVGKPPRTALVVEAEEVFTHCPKAFVRSSLWDPESWLPIDQQPSPAAMLRDHVGDDSLSVSDVESAMAESLRSRLA